MKILIISLPRTGSTELLYRISNQNNLKAIFEPFDGSGRFAYNSNMNNIVVKTIIIQYPSHIKSSNKFNWFVNFTKEFDKVILLSRRNIKELCESYAYFLYYKDKGFDSISEYKWKMTPNYDNTVNKINSMLEDIQTLSEKLNIPLTYYEDICDVNSPNRLRKFITSIDKLL
jgi:hypothetical protein